MYFMNKFFLNKVKKQCAFSKGACDKKTEFSLSNLKIGESGIILGYMDGLQQKVKRRLLELGFVKCARVRLENVSFLKEVLLVEVNGYLLSVRKNIASKILCIRE